MEEEEEEIFISGTNFIPLSGWKIMCGCCASRSHRRQGRKRKIKSKPKVKAKQTRHYPKSEDKQVFEPIKVSSEKEIQEVEEWQERRKNEKVKPSQGTTTTKDPGIFDSCLCCLEPGDSDSIIIVNERPRERERREQRLREENAQK
ncbi:hypothetical protein GQX74_014731 [Glossina fuscipes]|nr:hypothetical protein GQX74_014731 [Glossina fuscipes]